MLSASGVGAVVVPSVVPVCVVSEGVVVADSFSLEDDSVEGAVDSVDGVVVSVLGVVSVGRGSGSGR